MLILMVCVPWVLPEDTRKQGGTSPFKSSMFPVTSKKHATRSRLHAARSFRWPPEGFEQLVKDHLHGLWNMFIFLWVCVLWLCLQFCVSLSCFLRIYIYRERLIQSLSIRQNLLHPAAIYCIVRHSETSLVVLDAFGTLGSDCNPCKGMIAASGMCGEIISGIWPKDPGENQKRTNERAKSSHGIL